MLLYLASCCLPLPGENGETPKGAQSGEARPVQAPASLCTPNDSERARPSWELSTNYAPQADTQYLDLSQGVEAPVGEGVLVCEATSHLVEGRILARRQSPDLQAQLRAGGQEVFVVGPDNLATITLSAPLVRLEPDHAISLTLWDRQPLRVRELGSLHLSAARLPMTIEADGLDLTCRYASRSSVEPLVEPALSQARGHIGAWKPTVDLDAADLGPTGDGALAMEAIRRAAALVGWCDPRVEDAVARFEEPLHQQQELLAAELRARRASVSPGWGSLGDVEWNRATLVDADTISRLDGPSAPWGVTLPVRPVAGPVDAMMSAGISSIQLIDTNGGPWGLTIHGTLDPPTVDFAPTITGETTLLLTPMGDGLRVRPQPPLALRAAREGGYAWQVVD